MPPLQGGGWSGAGQVQASEQWLLNVSLLLEGQPPQNCSLLTGNTHWGRQGAERPEGCCTPQHISAAPRPQPMPTMQRGAGAAQHARQVIQDGIAVALVLKQLHVCTRQRTQVEGRCAQVRAGPLANLVQVLPAGSSTSRSFTPAPCLPPHARPDGTAQLWRIPAAAHLCRKGHAW